MATGFEIEFILWILIIVSIVSVIVRRIRMPYTLGLILAGLLISVFDIDIGLRLTPELLLTLFLPGLLFEASMNIDTEIMSRHIKSLSAFAVFGLFLSVMGTGSLLHFLLRVPWEISFLFASMIAPTDPIAVLAIFKNLGVSKRLSVLVEGESLFNDGTGIVIFRIILGLVTTGTFSLLEGVLQFVTFALGGLLLGFVLGYLASMIVRNLEDSLIQLTLTTVVAYGSYLIAEHLHYSGVIATVTAGLVAGAYGIRYLAPHARLKITSFWGYIGFLLNSFVFLLIGVELDILDLVTNIIPIIVAFVSVLVGRAFSVYFFSSIINRVGNLRFLTDHDEHIPRKWQHVIIWGGLHGGLSMVLVLSLPTDASGILGAWRPFLLATIFGTVFLSLVFQGMTMAPLLKFLGLSGKKERSLEYEQAVAQLVLNNAGEKELNRMKNSKLISRKVFNRYRKQIVEGKEESENKICEMLKKYPEIEVEQIKDVESAILVAQKTALVRAFNKGHISKLTLDEQLLVIDEKRLELNYPKTDSDQEPEAS